jgi:phage-related protein
MALGFFQKIGQFFKTIAQKALPVIKKIIPFVAPIVDKFKPGLGSTIGTIAGGATDALDKMVNNTNTIKNSPMEGFANMINPFSKVGKNMSPDLPVLQPRSSLIKFR